MVKIFIKKKDCGCLIQSITCGITSEKMYLIGGHKHIVICDKCKYDEENDIDTLYNMWVTDNITNDHEFSGWVEKK
jgi:hypothetical protein